MGFQPGTKLESYEVVAPLGAGGMGEVYRARDTRLGRDVALKVLPESLAGDPERMARFKREAQVLASLNHPNIATIYGFEESGNLRALVMELVEGPTLAETVSTSHGMPSQDVLPIAKQVADALEYAHEKGVIHRDLKPANVKITPEGQVKVLDFGLAKALDIGPAASSDISNSPTLTAPATQAGVILGTAAYMSPEQAKGKSADRRADVWSFGCVLFEMLTGRRAFEGDSTTDTLAAVLRSEPDWDALPADTPAAIRRLLRRCLAKDIKQRLQAIGEARITIEEAISGVGTIHESPLPAGETPKQRKLPWAITAVVLIGLATLAGWWFRGKRATRPPNWSGQMLGGPPFAMGPRISPDGHTLAFQATVDRLTQVAVMDTQSGDWTVLTKNRSRGLVTELNWSPDGSEIYFDRMYSVPKGIYTVSRFGGDERLVLKDAKGPEVLPDGSLLVTRLNNDRIFQLYHFWPESDRLEALDALPYGEDLCPAVRVFHDGKEAVFFGKTSKQAAADPSPHLHVIDLASGKSRRLAPQISIAVPSTLPIFALAVSSDDQSVLVDQMEGNLHRIISIPRNGTGAVQTLLTLTLPPVFLDMGKNGDLYMDQLDRPYGVLRFPASGGTPELLAGSESSGKEAHYPVQLPDGRTLLGSMVAGHRKLLAVAEGGESAPIIQTKEDAYFPASRVGKDELAFLLGAPGHAVLALASLADAQIVRRLDQIPAGEITSLAASPDGKTIYYVASGTVWAVPASGGQPRRRVAAGDSVAADPNGRDLIVQIRDREGIRLMRVPVSGGTETPIPIQGGLRMAGVELNPDAVGKDGRVLFTFTSPDSWYYGAAILDPHSGKVEKIPLNFAGDVFAPGWLVDGRVTAAGLPTRVMLWRFRPETPGQK